MKKTFIHKEVLIYCLFVLLGINVAKNIPGGSDFKLVILHVNDIHAHVEKTSEDLTR